MARGADVWGSSEQQRELVSYEQKDYPNCYLLLLGSALFFFLPSNTRPKPPSPKHYITLKLYLLVQFVMILYLGQFVVDEDLLSKHEL